jgi:hypothetical protein
MHKHQSEAFKRQVEALEAKQLKAVQEHARQLEHEQAQLKYLQHQQHALVHVLTAASTAFQAPSPSTAKMSTVKATTDLPQRLLKPTSVPSGLEAMTRAESKYPPPLMACMYPPPLEAMTRAESKLEGGKGCGGGNITLEAMTRAESKLTLQHRRLAFAVKRLSVAKALIQARAAGAAREHSLIMAQLTEANKVAKEKGVSDPANSRENAGRDCGGGNITGGGGKVTKEEGGKGCGGGNITCDGGHATKKKGGMDSVAKGSENKGRDESEHAHARHDRGGGALRDVDDDVQTSLLEEIERLMHERDQLLERIAGYHVRAEAREAELAAESQGIINRLTNESKDAREQLCAALADASADAQRVLELKAELEGVVAERRRAADEFARASDELALSKAALEAEKTRTILAVESAVCEVKEASEEEARALRTQVLHLQRDISKHVVQLRQMERQLAAAKTRSERDDVLRLRLLEERLAESQEVYVCMYICMYVCVCVCVCVCV